MGVEEIPHFANRGEKLKGGAYGLKMLNICSTNIYKNPWRIYLYNSRNILNISAEHMPMTIKWGQAAEAQHNGPAFGFYYKSVIP